MQEYCHITKHTETGRRIYATWNLVYFGLDNSYAAQSHDLNQCWLIVNGNRVNKLQCNLSQNMKIFIIRKCVWKCRLWNGSDLFRFQWVTVIANPRWRKYKEARHVVSSLLSSYPGYFREVRWIPMGLPEISMVTLSGMCILSGLRWLLDRLISI